ncbi:YciI family protein [Polaromonas sp. C04]|uniref:YciI family protein n=1 Tax=Polaromonas sp. C04 TaxID=1945857 RepID=UPI000984AD66|nr:YciI family protein [Polaromonas sp. C04]OOG50625.1 dehydrogenase [Polaromonas sp. C04]
MTHMLLILEPTGQRQTRTEAEGRAAYDSMVRFAGSLKARGVLRATESLASHAAAARVQASGGKLQVLDGPFAEAKEMIGGFFLIDCSSFDEAVAIARECPAAQWATVEVRALAPCYDDSAARPAQVARAAT